MVSLSEGDYNIHFVNSEFVWTDEDGNGVGSQPSMMLSCHGGRVHNCLFRHEYMMPMSQAATRFILITDAEDTERPNYASSDVPLDKKYAFDASWPDAHDWTPQNGFWDIRDNRFENIHARVAYAFGVGTAERCKVVNDQWDERCRVSVHVLRTTGAGLLQFRDVVSPSVESW